jgi:MFS family permease
MDILASAGSLGGGTAFLVSAPIFFLFAYLFLFWDSRRADSPAKDDEQILLKAVLFFLLVVGVAIAAGGLVTLFHYLLSGAKTGTESLKQGLAGVIAGAIPVLAVLFALLPRTNFQQQTKATRLTLGYLAVVGGMTGFLALYAVIAGLIMSAGWPAVAGSVASFLVMTGIGIFSVFKLGGLSNWSVPVRPQAQMPQAHPQGGYPQQAGYPPQQAGYPPQQGYPQQGGYPPQGGYGGGGYGGGGMPQGGGGYPPGGYQPR